jgi:hypothetical protein
MEKSIAKEAKSNPKKFWRYANSKAKVRSYIPNLSKSGNPEADDLTTSDIEKTEVLAEQFASVYTREDHLPPLQDTILAQPQSLGLDISAQSILKKLDKVKITKSPGPDNIHPRIIYEVRTVIAKPLEIIFRNSLCSYSLPQDWKRANITAIYKKGPKIVASNYRPVSLTSIICKIFEGFFRDGLVNFMMENNLLSDRQFGFLGGRSTVLQMLHVLEKWTDLLDNGNTIDIIYFDFMKAFDTVPHKRLLRQLQLYGIPSDIVEWIKAYLSHRHHRVCLNGISSTWHDVLNGIPQGSVLGPILFIIYINTLPDQVLDSDIFLFADDTKIFRKVNTEEDQHKLQMDINRMYNWTQESLLKFHPDKCNVLRLGKSDSSPQYKLDTKHLEARTSIKDLGITVDNKLNFQIHMAEKIKKANSIMGLIRRTYEYLDHSFLLLYKGLIRPILEYANQIWSPHLNKDILALEMFSVEQQSRFQASKISATVKDWSN